MNPEFRKCLLYNKKSERIRKNPEDKFLVLGLDGNNDLDNEEILMVDFYWKHSKAYVCPEHGIFYITTFPKYIQRILYPLFSQNFEHERLSYVV